MRVSSFPNLSYTYCILGFTGRASEFLMLVPTTPRSWGRLVEAETSSSPSELGGVCQKLVGHTLTFLSGEVVRVFPDSGNGTMSRGRGDEVGELAALPEALLFTSIMRSFSSAGRVLKIFLTNAAPMHRTTVPTNTSAHTAHIHPAIRVVCSSSPERVSLPSVTERGTHNQNQRVHQHVLGISTCKVHAYQHTALINRRYNKRYPRFR